MKLAGERERTQVPLPFAHLRCRSLAALPANAAASVSPSSEATRVSPAAQATAARAARTEALKARRQELRDGLAEAGQAR